jgi:hypothetical protein
VPCEVPASCRVSYYTGKLLTARDFSEEQRYHIDKRRLHHMALHGWGVVCGLKVKPHPLPKCPRLVVEAGLAIDQCGREVRLLKDVELTLPQPEPPPPPDPCPPEPAGQAERQEEHQHKHHKLWVCLRYCEREEQFSPAPFDECVCTGTVAQKPNRVCESYCLELAAEEPKILKEIEKHKQCGCEDCWDLYKSLLDPCKQVECDCIPLAVINHFRPGHPVTEEMIDNWTHRLFLPSVHRLDQVVRCILEKLPHRRLTHISEINWTHGEEVHCPDFMHRFVGEHRGFEIRFDGDIRREGVTRTTFQAEVVHHAGHEHPRRVEIAPADVEFLGERHIRLRIHEEFARHHLDGHNFELFITLKCDLVVDERGVPVDGDLQARLHEVGSVYAVHPPTGDGVPGGLFESWIRVRSGESRGEYR